MTYDANPTSEVWTAIAWDGNDRLLAADLHFNRLARHSKILEINLPLNLPKIVFDKLSLLNSPEESINNKSKKPFLVKVTVNRDSQVSVTTTPNKIWKDSPLNAISMSAPDVPTPILGTKHAAWHHYINAREQATKHGADISLFFLNNFLIDGDRCTPVILDNDGVAYYPKNSDGALDSVTLEQLKVGIEVSGIPIREAKISLEMILRSYEMIVLGSGLGVLSIGNIDGQNIGNPKGKLYQAAKKIWLNRLELGWLGFEDIEV